jgi:hypothetical protein
MAPNRPLKIGARTVPAFGTITPTRQAPMKLNAAGTTASTATYRLKT